MKRVWTAFFTLTTLTAVHAWAQEPSPVGLWKNIDDQTGKAKALIRITEGRGEYNGKVERLFREAGEEQAPKCNKCEGPLKDQPILGMTILSGMKAQGHEAFGGGQILDPANGKLYQSKMALVEGGKKLSVRGYIGMPLLGRTQTWVREE